MSWRVARSLLTLRDQVNRMAPNRDKSSDGTIGDERHQTTKSEHNPDANGVVRAMDITHDPAHGVDARKLAEALVASRDTRILYLISNAQIVSSVVKPWIWRRYNGINPHRHHMHISVVPEPHLYDDIRPWDLSALELKEDATSPQTPDASSVPASADTPLSIADVTPTLNERIIATVGVSDVPNLIWSDRGLAPSGYAKGMAVAFARVYAKWKMGNSAALVMAAANNGDDIRDALSWYNSRFQRGINTLAIDGPGQAEALRLRNIHSRHDYEVAGTAAYDYVASRAEVDPKRVAVMGYSFGGYHAPRIVAFEKRYAAAVAFGAMHWNIYDWVAGNKAKLATAPRRSSTSIFQFRWVVGAPDNETALEWAKKFTLEGIAQRIECAFLVLHGENDRIVPLAEAKKLYERVGSKRKHIKIFTAEEGGAEHCQVDHRQLGIDYIGDWLLANM